MLKIAAVDAQGKRRKLEAVRLEIQLPGGRLLTLTEDGNQPGDLILQGSAGEGAPRLGLQPLSADSLGLRVDLPPAASPRLEMEVQKALEGDDRLMARPRKTRIRAWARAALERDAVVTVRLVGEAEGRELNRDYRGKDYPTNVLTFVYGDELPADAGAPLMGDLVLCVPVVVREALEQCKSPEAHYAHLVVHGMLHLQGYDHEDDVDAQRMEARERAILALLGYADPYAETAA
ncbi:MAG: rRNA maturation RNase YbeY [Rhodocyclaceae bacterium]|jgi:probable rRNA maturation factor|nr:rRNA maturation RNase YbeY [Rhodocyclaceae bacterium]